MQTVSLSVPGLCHRLRSQQEVTLWRRCLAIAERHPQALLDALLAVEREGQAETERIAR